MGKTKEGKGSAGHGSGPGSGRVALWKEKPGDLRKFREKKISFFKPISSEEVLSGADALGKGERGEVDQGESRHGDKRSNAVAIHSVTYILINCEDERKWDDMVKFLEGMQPEKVIVFVRSRTKADCILGGVSFQEHCSPVHTWLV